MTEHQQDDAGSAGSPLPPRMTLPSGEIVPFPGAPAAPIRGWHGMTARSQKRYSNDDWKTWGDLAVDQARIVDSAPGSPGWLGDLRRGVWILSINGMGFDDFERSAAAVGATVEVKAFSPGLGSFNRKFALVEPPAKTSPMSRQRSRVPPAWRREQPVLPGKQVFKDTRAGYLELAARHPVVRRHVWLLTRLLKMQWHRGIVPRHKTIAEAVGCSTAAVKRSQACCQHFGFLRVISGKRFHQHNTYEVTWPIGSC
jgi:hypothetical protein